MKSSVKIPLSQIAFDGSESGNDGDSAYQIWLEQGNSGTEQDFLNSLKGEDGVDGADGDSAYQIWLNQGNTGTEQDFLNSLKGADGEDGSGSDSSYDDTTINQRVDEVEGRVETLENNSGTGNVEENMGFNFLPVWDEFTWSEGSQVFTLSGIVKKEIFVSVQGQILHNKEIEQYSIDGNQLTILDELDSGNIVKIVYIQEYQDPYTYEDETISFMTATSIPNDDTITVHGNTGNETWNYFDSLIKRAKSDGIWGNVKAWFPMLGGTVDKHKLSVINNDLYEMVFEGGWTIDANGNKGNGTDNIAYPLDNPLKDNGDLGLTIGYNTGGNVSFIIGHHAGSLSGDSLGRFHIVNLGGDLQIDFNHGDASDFPTIAPFGTRGIISTGYNSGNGMVVKDGEEIYNEPLLSSEYDSQDETSIGYGARVAPSTYDPYHSTVRLTSWLFHDGDPANLPLYNQLIQDWENFLNR